MVEIPEYYYSSYSYEEDGITTYLLLLYPYDNIGKKSNGFYSGAFEAMSDDSNSDASTKKLYSICNTDFTIVDNIVDPSTFVYDSNAINYRGGSARTTATDDDTIKSKLGRPVTNLTRAQFRTRANNRGTGWSQ
jgi:hypothetical protein